MDTYKAILGSSSENEQKFYALAKIIQQKESDTGLSGLKELERKFYVIDVFLSQVNNGGFDQFFFNTNCKYNNELLSILEELKLSSHFELLNRAIEIYNSSLEENDRMDELDELDDEFYDSVDYKELFTKVIGLFIKR